MACNYSEEYNLIVVQPELHQLLMSSTNLGSMLQQLEKQVGLTKTMLSRCINLFLELANTLDDSPTAVLKQLFDFVSRTTVKQTTFFVAVSSWIFNQDSSIFIPPQESNWVDYSCGTHVFAHLIFTELPSVSVTCVHGNWICSWRVWYA